MKRILIVEDISETRKWLCNAARTAFPGCEIRECSSAREGMFAASGRTCRSGHRGPWPARRQRAGRHLRLSKAQPEALVIVATVMGDDASIISALSLGAQGYLLKDTPADMFVRQLAHIGDGVPALSPSIARRIVDHFRATAEVPAEGAGLTPRERDVLRLIGRGLRNAEAARALGLSDSTVASHIKSIYSKLGITTRAEAALRALTHGPDPRLRYRLSHRNIRADIP